MSVETDLGLRTPPRERTVRTMQQRYFIQICNPSSYLITQHTIEIYDTLPQFSRVTTTSTTDLEKSQNSTHQPLPGVPAASREKIVDRSMMLEKAGGGVFLIASV